MTRYVGTGVWIRHGLYGPSDEDLALAQRIAAATAERVNARPRRRTGYGLEHEVQAGWYRTGFLGEVAGLRPFDAGPDLDAWEGRGRWIGSTDYHQLEVRTTSSWQLYGFALAGKHGAGLAGWRVTAKDAGRIIVCVEERQDGAYRLWGAIKADDVSRLREPLGSILAIVEPPELQVDVWELVP